jgi:nucleoside 2-deoxyribosyltransferase
MKNKYFIAYRYSGEDQDVLQERIGIVVNALRRAGIEAYCNLFDQHEYDAQKLSAGKIMEKAFQKLDESDGLFVLIASNEKSEGQLMEVGYARKAGLPIIVAVREGVNTYVPEVSTIVIHWREHDDLASQLETLTLR